MPRQFFILLLFGLAQISAIASISSLKTTEKLSKRTNAIPSGFNIANHWKGTEERVNYASKALNALNKPSASVNRTEINAEQKAKAVESIDQANLLFIENNGQIADSDGNLHPEILFTANSGGVKVFVSSNSLHYVFTQVEFEEGSSSKEGNPSPNLPENIKSVNTYKFTVELEGANPNPDIVKGVPSSYYETYYLAHCPNGVVARSYEKFTLKNVYPGVDWVIYSNEGNMKYDFVLAKASDVSRIKLKVRDAETSITPKGQLEMITSLGKVIEDKPISTQLGRYLETSFIALEKNTFGFKVEGVEAHQPLVIDPSIVWGGFYGGRSATRSIDYGYAGAIDLFGNLYICGGNDSRTFPTLNAFQRNFAGGRFDAFFIKFTSEGTKLWATYFGGTEYDYSSSCSVDQEGNLFFAGGTQSSNFPISNQIQRNFAGGLDCVVGKLSSTGQRLWATYFGGGEFDSANGCITDNEGNLFVTGRTASENMPFMQGFQPQKSGSWDAFLTKFSSIGTVIWSTFYGGSQIDWGWSCATDSDGNVFMTGYTLSNNFPVINAAQTAFGGSKDSFVAKFSSNGNRLWSTYLGGSNDEEAWFCTTDLSGDVIVTGFTSSTNFPLLNPSQSINGGGASDAFVSKISNRGTMIWSTFYGGGGLDRGNSCSVDSQGDIYVTGYTNSVNLPLLDAFQPNYAGGTYDAYILKLSGNGVKMRATYYGGPDNDLGWYCSSPERGIIYIVGGSSSTILPLIDPAPANPRGNDLFVVKFRDCELPLAPTVVASGPTSFCAGGSVTLTAPEGFTYLWSNGDTTRNITVSTAGSYSVRIFGNGCSALSAPVEVRITQNPNKPQIVSDTSTNLCEGDTITLTAPEGYTYIWSNGDTTRSIRISASGTYTTRVITNTCTSEVSDPVIVTVNPRPQRPQINLLGQNNFCTGDSATLTGPEGFQYLWSNGATTRSITIRNSGLYTLRVIQNGCTSTESQPVNITVLPIPEKPLIIANNPTTFCSDRSIILQAPSGFQYLWSTGETTQNISINTSGIYSLRVIANGCTSEVSDPVVISVVPVPPIPTIAILGRTTLCVGETVTLSAPEGFSYLWSTGEVSQSITTSTPGVYSLRVINTVTGCTSSVSAPVEIVGLPAPPQPELTASGPTRFCEGGQVSLSGPIGNFRYRWSNGDTSRVIQVASAGLYSLQLISADGCEGPFSNPINIIVEPKPTARILGPETVCPSSEGVVFQIIPTNPRYPLDSLNIQWLSIEGTVLSSGTDTVLIRWPEGRSTTAKVLAITTTPLGCNSDTISLNIRINPRLEPLIPQGPINICSNESLATYATLFSVGSIYNWNVQGGDILSGQGSNRIAVQWDSNGPWSLSFQERLTTSDTICEGSSPLLNVTINPSPREDLRITGNTTFCGVATTQISLLGEGSSTYRWEVGELIIQGDSNRNSINLQAPRVGVYPIRVQETNSFGCSGPVYVDTLRFNPVPLAIAGENISFCANGSGVLGATNNPELTYRWEPNLGLDNANISQPRVSLNQAGEYVYRLIVQNSFGCLDTSEVRVNVFALPTKPTVSGNPSACEGDTVVLRVNNPESNNTYRWLTNTGVVSGNIIRANTSQQVVLEARNTSGCSTLSDTLNIIIYPLPPRPAISLQTDSLLCEGEPFQLSGPPAAGYRWSNGSNTQSQSLTGSQQISLRTLSVEGCLSPPSPPVNLRYLDVPLPSLAHNSPLLCPEKLSGTYSVRGGMGSTFEFSVVGGTITSSNDTSVTISFEQGSINRYLTVIETTERGCLSGPITLSFQVDELLENPNSPCQLSDFPPIIPNIITPNADGFNDRFEVKNLRYYPNAELVIYNRFGKQLFQLQPYDNSFSAASLPAGTYYYLFHSGRGQTFKGWVEVVR